MNEEVKKEEEVVADATEEVKTEEVKDAEVTESDEKHAPIGRDKQVRAKLKLKTFILDGSEDSQSEINAFLDTIDNLDRFFNAKEVTKHDKGVMVTFWYLERLPEEEAKTESFGE